MQYTVHLMPENVFLLYANTCAPWSLQTPKEMMEVFQLQKTPFSCRWSIKCLWFDRYYVVLHLTSWRVIQTRREKRKWKTDLWEFFKKFLLCKCQDTAADCCKRLQAIIRQHIQDNQWIRSSQHKLMKGRLCLSNLVSIYDKVTGSVGEERL